MRRNPLKSLLKKHQWTAQAIESKIAALHGESDAIKQRIISVRKSINDIPHSKKIHPEQELAKLGYLTHLYEQIDGWEKQLLEKDQQIKQLEADLICNNQQVKLLEKTLLKQASIANAQRQQEHEKLIEAFVLRGYAK